MPTERVKKTTTPESLPDAGGPERKRVLNVLAQRRYRQRRKEKIAALEAQARGIASPSTVPNGVATQSNPGEHANMIANPTFVDSTTGEEIVQTTTESSFAMFDFDQEPLELGLVQDFQVFTNAPTPIPSSPSSSPPSFPLTSDGAVFDVPALNATRTFLTIAVALNVMNHVYDPYYLHVLSPTVPALSTLPANLHPVAAQLTIPHHPILDLLPWPNVREKLICMFSLPSALRPSVAQEVDEEMTFQCNLPKFNIPSPRSGVKQAGAVVRLVQDLDDYQNGSGLRIHGVSTAWSEGNELLEDVWEIGDIFYRKWWWCLDQKVIDVSNRKRMERGLGRLRMVEEQL